MRAHLLEPLCEYPGGHTPWPCRCMKCEREIQPRYHAIRNGQGGCIWCASRKIDLPTAVEVMRAAHLEPQEPWPGGNKRPWLCRCTGCGHVSSYRYNDVQQGHGCSRCERLKRTGRRLVSMGVDLPPTPGTDCQVCGLPIVGRHALAETCGSDICTEVWRRTYQSTRQRMVRAAWTDEDRAHAYAAVLQWRMAHPERSREIIRKAGAKWYSVPANRAKMREQRREAMRSSSYRAHMQELARRRYWADPERFRAKDRLRRLTPAGAEANRAYGRRWRALKLSGEHRPYVEQTVFERDGWRCQIPRCLCPRGRRIDPHLPRRSKSGKENAWSKSIDHIVPLSRGGGDVEENVRACHLRCNTSRGARGGNDQLRLL